MLRAIGSFKGTKEEILQATGLALNDLEPIIDVLILEKRISINTTLIRENSQVVTSYTLTNQGLFRLHELESDIKMQAPHDRYSRKMLIITVIGMIFSAIAAIGTIIGILL